MPAGLLLGTARRAALGPLEPALGGLKAIWGSGRHFCSTLSKDVTYRELKTLLNSKDIVLIDVRDTWEILEHGKIPGSINIPSGVRSKKAMDTAISLGFSREPDFPSLCTYIPVRLLSTATKMKHRGKTRTS
ncbi:thiosulfate sulfurtransferase/rhodanese-like domain-containing protein 3 isoform X3 [Psammomys obesus]|uniref:thiosulfate sulfurtransferase/rhodanese-like domain-containing protein 3 isoform X3 n=1 Tax=Psammomys obesus TaxID=48139 RepID=UPI002452DEEB|nr:thiosulfate sulfurtransferase/rhodanese-like domain-containing protein 3 isoform X3 [Psammomys obesus]